MRSSLRQSHRVVAWFAIGALALASCTRTEQAEPAEVTAAEATTIPATPTTAVVAPTDPPSTEPATPPLAPATFEVRAGTEQITITGAEPGERLMLIRPADPSAGEVEQLISSGEVDEFGALIFRNLPGAATFQVRSEQAQSDALITLDRDQHPPSEFYTRQQLDAPGFGYLTTRDGTTLSVNVRLPGPAEDGPYPTVVEYSGYTPSDPGTGGLSDLFGALGYAYVGVNMRGTGCSGGSFRYFEYAQSLDGYDLIETIAAQPWVQGNQVGMIGISYPGISQLFVAQTRPPSLAAITPMSVIDDSFRSTLYPGGILNTGFAVSWGTERGREAQPEGQGWAAERIAEGDEHCASNQRLRLQNPDPATDILGNPYWSSPLGEELAPATFVDRVEVPVFIAGAWQDEQTGGRFPVMLDRFTATDLVFASLVNGLHTEALSPVILARYLEFLDLYVADRVPDLSTARMLAPVLGGGIFGTSELDLPEDRFSELSLSEARAAFEADPRVQILFEQGAADGYGPLAPMPRFVAGFDSWPIPEAEARRWSLSAERSTGPGLQGVLVDGPSDSGPSSSSYRAEPDTPSATFYEGSSSAIWRTDVTFDWQQPPPGTAVSFATDPLAEDLVVIGSGSADLWIRAEGGDTDLEVTITEIRPDGTEVLVQSGWLRASQRALDLASSAPNRPVHTHLEVDAALLPDGRFELVRVEIFPFAHVFRAGSQLRMTIDAPGGNRPVWAFDSISAGETVTIAHDVDHPSQLVLAVVDTIEVPAGVPACGALRGQPCRAFP